MLKQASQRRRTVHSFRLWSLASTVTLLLSGCGGAGEELDAGQQASMGSGAPMTPPQQPAVPAPSETEPPAAVPPEPVAVESVPPEMPAAAAVPPVQVPAMSAPEGAAPPTSALPAEPPPAAPEVDPPAPQPAEEPPAAPAGVEPPVVPPGMDPAVMNPPAPPPPPAEPAPVPPEPVPVGNAASCEGGQLAPGFHVAEGKILDNHCEGFVMRGVNYPYAWFNSSQNTEQMFRDIAATGANSVRVVLATGGQWPRVSGAQVSEIIAWAKANQLVAMLEVHDATGYGESAGAVDPMTTIDYWLSEDIKSAIVGQEAYVMVNIANEPLGNTNTEMWVPFHETAVQELRAGGLRHLFIVDAPNWGQDWTNTMRDGAGKQSIFDADPQGNVAFSVHMYDVYGDAPTVKAYFDGFLSSGLPLLVGEFAADHGPGKDVDEDTLMAEAEARQLGYLGWSWSGNGEGLDSLDIVQAFSASMLSPWGQRLVEGENGIRATSRICSCFDSAPNL